MKSESEVRRFLRLLDVQLSGPIEAVLGSDARAIYWTLKGQQSVCLWMLGEIPDPPGLKDVELLEQLANAAREALEK